MTDRPTEWGKWPIQVRELWDALVRAEASDDEEAGVAALEHLSGLIEGPEVETDVRLAAAVALLEYRCRIDPGAREEIAKQVRHMTRDGLAIVETAVELRDQATTDVDRKQAEDLLADLAAKIPPRGKA